MRSGAYNTAPAIRSWRLDLTQYDRTPTLSGAELDALAPLNAVHGWGGRTIAKILDSAGGAERLIRPLHDALALLEGNVYWKERALVALLRGCLWEQRAFWGWPASTWA